MALNPMIPMGFDTSQIYDPMKQKADNQTLALGQQKLTSGNMDIQTAKLERASQYLQMATPENWRLIRNQAISEGLGREDTVPQEFDQDWISRTTQAFAAHKNSLPSAIQEYQFYEGLPDEKKPGYIEVKRATPYLNLGDRFTNPATGRELPKGVPPQEDPAFKGRQKTEETKANNTVNAQANLPNAIANAEIAMNNIDAMIGNAEKNIPEHTGLEGAVGPVSSRLPTLRGDTADFEAKVEQAAGGAFLEAYETMKGGGAISEVEGAKATAARMRMKLATSEEGFREAAREYRDIIRKGIERAKAKAAGGALPSAASGITPPTPEEEAEYRRLKGMR